MIPWQILGWRIVAGSLKRMVVVAPREGIRVSAHTPLAPTFSPALAVASSNAPGPGEAAEKDSPPGRTHVSVIIPVKSPEPYLDELVERIEALTLSKEVLVQTEPGLSNAVRAGVARARGDVVAILDADGSHDPGYLPEMVGRLGEGHDLVLGSRYVEGGEASLGPVRGVISRVFTGVTRRVLGIRLEDPLTGMVVGRRALFRRLVYADKSFKFTLELLQHAENPVEHPILFKPRQDGASKVGLTQGLRSIVLLGTLYAARLNHRAQAP